MFLRIRKSLSHYHIIKVSIMFSVEQVNYINIIMSLHNNPLILLVLTVFYCLKKNSKQKIICAYNRDNLKK